MEREGSLPCANQPSASFCPEKEEPDHVVLPSIYLTSISILSSHLRLRPSSVFLHVVLPRHTTCISNMFHVVNSCLTKQNAK